MYSSLNECVATGEYLILQPGKVHEPKDDSLGNSHLHKIRLALDFRPTLLVLFVLGSMFVMHFLLSARACLHRFSFGNRYSIPLPAYPAGPVSDCKRHKAPGMVPFKIMPAIALDSAPL